MDRYILTDAQWAKMEPHCLGKVTDRGRSGTNNRLFLEAVLWIARTGSPWRDLPPEFGKWNTIFKRYRDWVKASVFENIFAAVNDDTDMEYAMIDGTIVKVHRHGQGAKGGPIQGETTYQLSLSSTTSDPTHSWTLTATPQGQMNNSGNLTLDSTGKQCWEKTLGACEPWNGK